jgi:hypothetical protein
VLVARKPYASPVEPKPKVCFQCGDREPRFPLGRPRFCSTDCMLVYAEWSTARQIWCAEHAIWFEQDDLCDQCEQAKHAEATL